MNKKNNMHLKNFFDNLKSLFEDETTESAPVNAVAYRNEEGEIDEIRIFNITYEEILIIEKTGTISAINIKELSEE